MPGVAALQTTDYYLVVRARDASVGATGSWLTMDEIEKEVEAYCEEWHAADASANARATDSMEIVKAFGLHRRSQNVARTMSRTMRPKKMMSTSYAKPRREIAANK